MNRICKAIGAIFLFLSVVPSFAETYPTADDAIKCVALKSQAANHKEWSAALRKINSNSHRFTTTQAYTIAKGALNKIYDDINTVRETAGLTEDVYLLDQTDDLLAKVDKEDSPSEKSTALMMDKLQELDDEMYETLRQAHKEFPNCDLFERRARAAAKKSSETKSADIVQ